MIFNRTAYWIKSKIGNKDKKPTFIRFLFCRHCWSFLWCSYWKSLKSDSHHPKTLLYLLQLNPFKNIKNAFYFILKTLLVLETFKFLCWFFGLVKERLDYKDKADFKNYDVTVWSINNYITHKGQYLTKERQPDNEIWPGNGINVIQVEKRFFFSKIMQKMR